MPTEPLLTDPLSEFADLFAAAGHAPAQFHGIELFLPFASGASELLEGGDWF